VVVRVYCWWEWWDRIVECASACGVSERANGVRGSEWVGFAWQRKW
jgi:hypothetical protein